MVVTKVSTYFLLETWRQETIVYPNLLQGNAMKLKHKGKVIGFITPMSNAHLILSFFHGRIQDLSMSWFHLLKCVTQERARGN